MSVIDETNSSTPLETPPANTETTPGIETPVEETPPADTTPPAGEAPAPLTPADIKLPEGFEAPEETLSSFTDIINDADLSANERAEKLMNLHADAMKQASEEISEQWTKTREGWVDTIKADSELGGDKLESDVLPTIGKLVTEFGTEELRGLMDESGMGDHPEFVRFLYKIGKSFKEGALVSGTPSSAPQSLADRLYGTKT